MSDDIKSAILITEERRQAIEDAIEASDKSLTKIAESIGLSKSNLSRVKRGKIKSMNDVLYMVLESKYLLPHLEEMYRHNPIPDFDFKQWNLAKQVEFKFNIDSLQTENNKLNEKLNIKQQKIDVTNQKLKEALKEVRKAKAKLEKMINTVKEWIDEE